MFGGFLKPSSRVLCAHTGKATANNVTGASEIHFLENIRYSSPLQSRYLVTVLLDLFTKRASTTLPSRFANLSATVMKYTGHADMETVLRYLSAAEGSDTRDKIKQYCLDLLTRDGPHASILGPNRWPGVVPWFDG